MNTAVLVFLPNELSRQEKKIQRTQDQGRGVKDLRNRVSFRMKRKTKRKKLAMEREKNRGK